VSTDCPEFGVEIPFERPIGRVCRLRLSTARVDVAQKSPDRRRFSLSKFEEPNSFEDSQETFATSSPSEWHACPFTAVNSRVVPNDVHVGIGVAQPENGSMVARTRLLAGRPQVKWIPRPIRDGLHVGPLPSGKDNRLGRGGTAGQ
jgi:hypothetical protein